MSLLTFYGLNEVVNSLTKSNNNNNYNNKIYKFRNNLKI